MLPYRQSGCSEYIVLGNDNADCHITCWFSGINSIFPDKEIYSMVQRRNMRQYLTMGGRHNTGGNNLPFR